MVRVEIQAAGLYQLINGPESPVNVDLDRRAHRVLEYQVAAAPVETGRLRADLHVSKGVDASGAPTRQIGSGVEYILDVVLGTGLYGKHHRRIYPVRAKALRWADASGVHFARSTRGQKPQDFLTPSLQAARD